MTLEKIDEPLFSNSPHGSRPSRGCHTTLEEIKNTWMGISWLLEFDIRKCYDTIDRHRLVSILQEEIHDQRFMDPILKLFKAEAADRLKRESHKVAPSYHPYFATFTRTSQTWKWGRSNVTPTPPKPSGNRTQSTIKLSLYRKQRDELIAETPRCWRD